MSKSKASYRCTNCAYTNAKWVGCCPTCKEWNSFVEQAITPSFSSKMSSTVTKLSLLQDIVIEEKERMQAGINEWDRVLGGGILPGSFIIITGDPGIGKSTLLLQVAEKVACNYDVIYFSSEESLKQIKNRALRLGIKNTKLSFSDQASLADILATSRAKKPHLVILDSIQNCYLAHSAQSLPGTVGQLREAGFQLMRLAKEHGIAVLTTGHVTKDGYMAGPKILEHIVDGVFYLQCEDRWQTRILRSVKNRFGTINEVGFFQMQEQGLIPVSDINKQLLNEASYTPGSSIVCSVEGSRPLLVEMQALVIASKYSVAQRIVTGLDPKRVILIAAILEKYLGVKLSQHDIFFKVSGGFKLKESATDLGIALALLSSAFQKSLPVKSVAVAELGLTGQIKPANQIASVIKEIEKFKLKRVFIAKSQKVASICQITAFQHVYELMSLFDQKN